MRRDRRGLLVWLGSIAFLVLVPGISADPVEAAERSTAEGAGPLTSGVDGVSVPKRIRKVYPEHPAEALEAHAGAHVTLQCVVRKDGSVDSCEPLKCQAFRLKKKPKLRDKEHTKYAEHCDAFKATAIETIEQWEYKPAVLNDTPVDVWFTVVAEFSK